MNDGAVNQFDLFILVEIHSRALEMDWRGWMDAVAYLECSVEYMHDRAL